ncbi:OLC1v1027013C1 [Oldenlandia corymbosa var. corymbosa]|uniref:OLC1v1027013C1 n=1 Tax=Oldenlandia corymbosa var. corymbosa TaxID=529605 RepID=A0AAV1CAP5_OLDCO|nr:OLC1v1027013C1 [Oldenlandia corymbosa var. corymbosa]
MGRKKQQPRRAVEARNSEAQLNEQIVKIDHQEEEILVRTDNPYFVEVDKSNWVVSGEHYDVSEIVLPTFDIHPEFHRFNVNEEFYQDSRYSLRFRLNNVEEHLNRIKLGHWPELSSSSIYLEFVEKNLNEGMDTVSVIMSGNLDGPDEGVSGLVHLASLNFLTLRPQLGFTLSEGSQSVRLRVEILQRAFDACTSLVDESRKLWKRSMMNVMAWLRPEVLTSEARYRYLRACKLSIATTEEGGNHPSGAKKRARIDIGGFYEAITPSKAEPMLDVHLPGLLPELRPYQRRAAYWMVQREKGAFGCWEDKTDQLVYPLCVPLNLIDTSSTVYYNPFCGNISLHPEPLSSYVSGGILADEMGLGKTVELLACVFAHRMPASETLSLPHKERQSDENKSSNLRRPKMERIECVCGAVSESIRYKGLWVQCDICDAWQHGDCVGFSANGRAPIPLNSDEQGSGEDSNNSEVVVMEGVHICSICSELIQATESPVATGATLIVCPTPILSQWHAEIKRHTTPGSLRICIYDGVKDTLCSDTSSVDINELVNADIVLTTYDALKDDLSHDSDRYEADRRSLRFEKRYPVVPTLLTRILWWRICLDEAQMVESNAAAATEMALRLHGTHRWCITGTPMQRKLDDLYGLLKFLRASPFDAFRWWAEVIRDPYEAGDPGAIEFTHSFLKKIMWRSSKLHVAEELQIPAQEECVSWLTLSPIEEHFYQRQHDTCLKDAHEVLKNLKHDVIKRNAQGVGASEVLSDRFITHLEAAKLFNSLLKLRQACCHPQVGSSGLRSLQQSPMTMEEILSALIGKTKVEGEDAVRKLVSAINGLAGIAILKKDIAQAVSLYKEALAVAEENAEEFRLDPLLNIHIHHNLADILPLSLDNPQQCQEATASSAEDGMCGLDPSEHRPLKRARIASGDSAVVIDRENLPEQPSSAQINACSDEESSQKAHCSSQLAASQSLSAVCHNLKQKFLSAFYSKLSMAQKEFRNSYDQICSEFSDGKGQESTWWLNALHYTQGNTDLSRELIRKIEETLSAAMDAKRPSKVASSFSSITALKYYIQTGLDSLEESRKSVLGRVLEIDSGMEHPNQNDVERVRHCPNCQDSGDGLLCIHCELDDLFQAYEARLFKTSGDKGEAIGSAEDAVDMQRKKSALNRFYRSLSQTDKKSGSSSTRLEDDGRKRNAKKIMVVSKSPSDLEVVLGIIKKYSKGLLDREDKSAAKKQLSLLEAMRKEYALARSLARAQAQVLRAHDEVQMAISRLRLREDDKDNSIDALSPEELDAASTQNSSEKFLALSSLTRIRGQFRYLKSLVQSKQNLQSEATNESTAANATEFIVSTPENKSKPEAITSGESCPVCQEKLKGQKMVFQCGHIVCFKCFFAMTERRFGHHGKNWVMCPTCRQHSDYGSIAFADDRSEASRASSSVACANSEMNVTVEGSYSTKIQAVTRRILSIKSKDPTAKVLVFTSWNDVLDVLEHAFVANKISYVRMKGGRKSQVAVSHFRGLDSEISGTGKRPNKQSQSDFVQVLLILVQHGANGLNLLEAQHVILVEPLLNPAAEAQAIGRVHRIGQDKKTLVHRFIVKDTVEESIYKLNRSRNMGSFVGGNRKNQDQPVLTLKDVESLFRVIPSAAEAADEQQPNGSLSNLPPSMAAAIAAEKRLLESKA